MKFICLEEDFPWTKNAKKNNITKTKKEILNKSLKYNLYKVNSYDINDISYSMGYVNNTIIIDSNNINNYCEKNLVNVYLFVDDETELYNNFNKIWKITRGWISLKLKDLNEYDIDTLTKEIKKIYNIYKTADIKINEFEHYIYDKDLLLITDRFDITLNSYYYENDVIGNVIYNTNVVKTDVSFTSEFASKNKIFETIIKDYIA